MTRNTSKEAYQAIISSGLLSERRKIVYEILFHNGPMTASMLVEMARSEHGTVNSGSFGTRLTELRNLGIIDETKIAPCPLTGMNVIWWDVNGKSPKETSTKQRIVDRINRCEERLLRLKQKYYKNTGEFYDDRN